MKSAILGEPEPLRKRRLTVETCKLYKIHVHGSTLRFHYLDDKHQHVGTKVRHPDKEFSVEGGPLCLFGMNLFPSKGKRIVITEGEIDAASCHQAMPGWPMVSIPQGAPSAKKALQKHLDYLQGYEEIVLFFDNDEAGHQAAQEAATVLPSGKVKIAALNGYKDASEAMQAKDEQSIRTAIWNANPYRPDGIIAGNSDQLMDLVLTPLPPHVHEYPWPGLQEKLGGIRYGELITVTAGTGIGKSSFCRQLAVHMLSNGETMGYLALEESNRRTALGMLSVAAGKALHLNPATPEETQQIWEQTLQKWNLFLFDGFGSYDPQVIYDRIEYLAQGMETRVIVLDHLSILLSGLEGDERRTIDQTMTKLRSLVEKTGITMFLVCHLRRNGADSASHEEGGRVTLGHLRGSQSIAQLSDAVIALERDQQATEDITTVRVLKDRYNGQTGVACQLIYDPSTCRFHEDSFDAPAVFSEEEY